MKIDTTQIEGYADMSAEDKLKALEGLDIPDPDYTGYVKKDLYDKTASELSKKKKELNERMSADEQAQQAALEKQQDLEAKYEALLRESTISKRKADLLALGYEDSLADKTAKAMADGDLESVLKYQKQHQDAYAEKVKASILAGTPKPDGGSSAPEMTLEKLKSMPQADRIAYYNAHPDDYKTLYEGDK